MTKKHLFHALSASLLSMLLTACQSTPPKPTPYHAPVLITKNTQVLEVMPNRMPCDSASPMQCLLVKPAQASDSEIFGIGFGDIKGFEPRTGVYYKIRASQEFDQRTDQPTGKWQLDEILSQSLPR